MEELLALLDGIKPLSSDLRDHLRRLIKKIDFKKHEMILRYGQISSLIFYIKKGLIIGSEWQKGQEVTAFAMRENDICISPESFFDQTPTEQSMIALERTEAWGISYQELQGTYDKFPEFNLHGRIITERYYVRSMKLVGFMKRHTGKEKYKILMEKDPELVNRVPSKYMASYLNVNQTTLSSIRSQFRKDQKKKS